MGSKLSKKYECKGWMIYVKQYLNIFVFLFVAQVLPETWKMTFSKIYRLLCINKWRRKLHLAKLMLQIGFAYIGVKFIVNKRMQNMQICARKRKNICNRTASFCVRKCHPFHSYSPWTSVYNNWNSEYIVFILFSSVYDTFDAKLRYTIISIRYRKLFIWILH